MSTRLLDRSTTAVRSNAERPEANVPHRQLLKLVEQSPDNFTLGTKDLKCTEYTQKRCD